MKILVSGASGYIGSHLLKSLIDDKVEVGIIGRSFSMVEIPENVEFYNLNIAEPLNIVLNKKYDIFIHLASANDVDSVDTRAAILTTTLGTKHCLDLCKQNGINKFVYFSTFQVYGKVEGFINEQTKVEPKNDYAITHKFGEDYVKMYQQTCGISYIIVRPTNIYGAPLNRSIDRWTLVPNCFCKEAFEKKTITLLSSGKQSRDFVDLSDLVNITRKLCESFYEFENKTVNIASGNNFTILEIAQLVIRQYEKIFGKKCDLIIKSEYPLESNQFNIELNELKRANFIFKSKTSIIDEINSIFGLLKNN